MKYVNGDGHLLIMDVVTILDGNGEQGHSKNHMNLQFITLKHAHYMYVYHFIQKKFHFIIRSSRWDHSLQLLYTCKFYTMNCLFSYHFSCWNLLQKKFVNGWNKRAMYLLLLGPPIHIVKFDMRFKGWAATISERSLCLLPIFTSCYGIGGGVGTKRWANKMLDCTHVGLLL